VNMMKTKNQPLVSVVIPTHDRKEMLVRLIKSIKKSTYKNLEIIVVDDASSDGTYEYIKKKSLGVKIFRNKNNLLLAASRNVGIKKSIGKYVFLIDDDNVIDKSCISCLVEIMEKDRKIGIIGPIVYYYSNPRRIWCAGVRRNKITSLTKIIERDKFNRGQLEELISSEDFPNAFMIRRDVVKKVGLFDEKLFSIHYDEADFGERVRKADFKIVCYTKAEIWHDIPLPEKVEDKSRLFHVHNDYRAYSTAKNRIIFHKKYYKGWKFCIFILFFNWLFSFYYLKIILFNNSNKSIADRIKVAKSYIRGIKDAFVFSSG